MSIDDLWDKFVAICNKLCENPDKMLERLSDDYWAEEGVDVQIRLIEEFIDEHDSTSPVDAEED